MRRRALLLGLLAARAAAAQPAGSVTDFSWNDPARGRELPLRVRWPAGDDPCTLVLYSHGLGGSRDGGDAWGTAWRDAGIAVLHLQHPGSDAAVIGGGWAALRSAAGAAQLLVRVADVRFVLDEIGRRSSHPPWSRLSADAIGMAGHSFGAVTAQALAGQRFSAPAPAAPVSLAEARLKAFAAFSPSPARASTLSLAQQFGAIERPLMCVTGSLDDDPLGEGMTAQRRASVFEALPAGRSRHALLWLAGADHMALAGNAGRPIRRAGAAGRRDPVALRAETRVHALAARVSTLWWMRYLGIEPMAEMTLHAVPKMLGPGDRWWYV
jgi:hypothetical protein